MVFLGIDTSCYTTSSAAVDENGNILFDSRIPLTVKDGNCGLRQSDMVFQHIKNIKNTAQYTGKITAVAASASPRPADGSYMPVFVVSDSIGSYIANVSGAKYYPLTHQHGHIGAALIGKNFEGELLALHASGGTTEVLKAFVLNGIVSEIQLIGGTLDISAGQLIDRIANRMGLLFPGGAHIEELAKKGNAFPLKICAKGSTVNFSGMETALEKMLDEKCNADIAAAALLGIAKALTKLINNTVEETKIKTVLLMGGVMRNIFIRDYIVRHAKCGVLLSDINLSSDNACGLAMQARAIYLEENK